MALVCGSAHLDDDQFMAAFNAFELPLGCFRHADHLRLAWIQVHRYSLGEALALVREGIKKFAAHHGVPHIFHETMTTAWVKLVATHQERSFDEFLELHDSRLNKTLLLRFWTAEVLESEAARRGWVDPDREPLPV